MSQSAVRATDADEADDHAAHDGGRGRLPWLTRDLRRAGLAGLVFTFVWAAACNALLDVAEGTNGIDSGFGMLLREKPTVFLVSTLLMWSMLGALVAITGRVVLAATLLLLVVAPVAVANREKIVLRGEPVYPADLTFLSQPDFLADMVGVSPVVAVLGLLVVLAVVAAVAGFVMRRVRRRIDPRLWRRPGPGRRAWLLARLVMLLTAALVATAASGFHSPGNPVRWAYDTAGAKWAPWSQRDNYIRHGVLAGMLYNLDVTTMDRPPGYSQARMEEIARRYQAVADRMNRGRSAATLRDTNVVVVLSEAFSDPTAMPGVGLGQDPIPFTRKLMTRTPSGLMRSPLIGGGTSNVEFEALTGESISQFTPQMTTPYQMLVAKQGSYPSAVGYFESLGMPAVGIHPFKSFMYQRDKVWPTFGFDRTVFEDGMTEKTRLDKNKYIDDTSAFDEVLRTLDSSGRPQFVQLVTMQNHYPMAGKYSDPIPVTGVSGDTADQLSAYARGLKYSDDALKSFLGSLEKSDKPTAVVFYGDHTPAFWASSSVSRKLGDDAPVFHETPYFLWSNQGDLKGTVPAVTSPIYFLPMLLDSMGAQLPPYYALLLQLQKQLPALLPGEYLTPDGEVSDAASLDERARRLLEDYRLVQYDLAAGARYSEKSMFYDPAAANSSEDAG